MTALPKEESEDESLAVSSLLEELTGNGTSYVRPPFGIWDPELEEELDMIPVLWTIDTLDWKTQDVQATVEEVMNNVQDGSIILMHDIYSTSVDAAEILIPQLIEDGYQLVTVHELAAAHGKELNPGITYGEFTS